MKVIETSSPDWKSGALTVVLHSQILEPSDGLEPTTAKLQIWNSTN